MKGIASKSKSSGSSLAPKSEVVGGSQPVFVLPAAIITDSQKFFKAVHTWFEERHCTKPEAKNAKNDEVAFVPIPWRQTPYSTSPYPIWVSEVMSQQTQLATVIRYWTAWMKAFPTIEALAAADPSSVRAVWAGMGYYRRADFLQKGAQYIVNDYRPSTRAPRAETKGSLAKVTQQYPLTYEEWVKLVPGVGPYTAAAITSICFDVPATAVDGNVLRVMSRLCGTKEVDPKNSKHLSILQGTLNSGLLAKGRARSAPEKPLGGKRSRSDVEEVEDNAEKRLEQIEPFLSKCEPKLRGKVNEGLMEIGASICRPVAAPLCKLCPLSSFCTARKMLEVGDIESIEGCIPMRGSATKVREEHARTLVVFVRSKAKPKKFKNIDALRDEIANTYSVCCVVRPKGGLLSEMTDFPYQITTTPSISEAKKRSAKKPQLKAADGLLQGSFVHVFSHIKMTVDVSSAVVSSQTEAKDFIASSQLTDLQWNTIALSDLSKHPVSQLALKGLQLALPSLASDLGWLEELPTKQLKELADNLCNRVKK